MNNRISIREIKKVNKTQIARISRLHMKAFPSFFLTQLGSSFLETLYMGYIEDEKSGIIIAEHKGDIIGFVAYSKDYSAFYKGLIKHHLLKFAYCSFKAALRHPSFTKRLVGAFKKSSDVVKEENYVELSSICVNPDMEQNGIGSALIDRLKEKVDFKQFAYINLETDAENNEKANLFYIKNGFKLFREYSTAEGRKMNEYRYTP